MRPSPHDTRSSVFEHLHELRNKLLLTIGIVIIGAVITHIFHNQIITFLLKPAGGQHLIFLSPLEPFLFIFKIDTIGGIILGFPVIIWCIVSFISPALPHRAKKLFTLFYFLSTVLLAAGLLYAILVTIPLTLQFLFSITVPGIENQISAQSYVGFFITQTLIIMAIFQIPIFIAGGIYIGFLKTATLARKRRYIYLITIIALAIITPTTDIFSLCIILLPCLAMFEVSLIGGRIMQTLKKNN